MTFKLNAEEEWDFDWEVVGKENPKQKDPWGQNQKSAR